MKLGKEELSHIHAHISMAACALESGEVDMKTADRDTLWMMEDILDEANDLLRGLNLLSLPAVARLRIAATLIDHYDSLTYKRGEFDA